MFVFMFLILKSRTNYQLVWTRRDWWLCPKPLEDILLNTGTILLHTRESLWVVYGRLYSCQLCLRGCFLPPCCRMVVWRSLLCLPENHAVYSSLTDKGLHSAFLTQVRTLNGHSTAGVKTKRSKLPSTTLNGCKTWPGSLVVWRHLKCLKIPFKTGYLQRFQLILGAFL